MKKVSLLFAVIFCLAIAPVAQAQRVIRDSRCVVPSHMPPAMMNDATLMKDRARCQGLPAFKVERSKSHVLNRSSAAREMAKAYVQKIGLANPSLDYVETQILVEKIQEAAYQYDKALDKMEKAALKRFEAQKDYRELLMSEKSGNTILDKKQIKRNEKAQRELEKAIKNYDKAAEKLEKAKTELEKYT